MAAGRAAGGMGSGAASAALPRRAGRALLACAWAVALIAAWRNQGRSSEVTFTLQATPAGPGLCGAGPGGDAAGPRQWPRTARTASVMGSLVNPVKTVADSIADFYKAYPQPPVLPLYRAFIIDLLTQTHLALVDSRFKYDAIFALGLKTYYDALMGNYDKLVGGRQDSAKIWKAMLGALALEPATVDADAATMAGYASSTPPAEVLKHMEGAAAPDARISEAFASIKSSLYSGSFSVGLFRMMELCKVEVNKANVEEWAKALGVPVAKPAGDLETYKLNKNKLQKAEEMIREVEIREKKKLAERLEAKAKALAAKAAAKAAEQT